MEKEAQLIGAYGRDRKEFLKYKSALLQAEKQTRTQANNRKLKDLYRKSPTPMKTSEPRPYPYSHSPVSHRTFSHKELAKRDSVQDRLATPVDDSIRDTTLNNYFWTQEDDFDNSVTLINGKPARSGPKLVAVVDQHADYYERELRKELKFLEDADLDSGRDQKDSLPVLPSREEAAFRVNGYLTPTYSLEPQIEMPRQKHDSLKKLTRRDRSSDGKASIVRGLPSIRESEESAMNGLAAVQAKRLYRVKAPPAPPKLSRRKQQSPEHGEEEQERRQQMLEESIHELDKLLLRIKKKQNIRSSSVMKDSKSKPMHRRRYERILPRLNLPHLSTHE